ncbi:MAG TPA: hypothetical protein VFR81_23450 [Longimicrobium sp.]|nr:hypothetical protein [Longimicrobium sp.]
MNQPHVPPPPPRSSGMAPWLKYSLIGCGGFVLLAALALGGVIWWASRNADRIGAGPEAVAAEGEAAGRGTDEAGCVEKALAYGGGSVAAILRVGAFADACLRACRPTPGFCDGVPQPTEFRRLISWQREQCRNSRNPACQTVMQSKMQACWQRRAGLRGDSIRVDSASLDSAGASRDPGDRDWSAAPGDSASR